MKRLLFQVAVPMTLLAVSLYAFNRPYFNWDMFPYMALTACRPSEPFAQTHARIYKEASQHMPPADFESISHRQPRLRDNPEEFQKILKYFVIKSGYLMVLRFEYELGMNLVMATYVPSVVSYFCISCLLFLWVQRSLPLPASALITLIAASSSFLLQTARYSSPDLLCAFMLIGGLYLATEYSILLGSVLGAVAVSVRPDAIILVELVILAFWLSKKISLTTALAAAAAGIILCFLIIGNPGILHEFLFTDSYSSEWSTREQLKHYLLSFKNGMPSLLVSRMLFFLLLAAIGVYFRGKYKERWELWTLLMIMAALAMVGRYLLHPVMEDRFIIASFAIIIVGLSKTLPYYLNTNPRITLP